MSSTLLSTCHDVHYKRLHSLQAPEEDKFDWATQWYPVAFVDDLDPTKPHSIELLGKRLVLWRDAEQQWRTFEDKCPHRLAPLSGKPLFQYQDLCTCCKDGT